MAQVEPVGTPQRERVRDSFRDALDGIDVDELQSGRRAAAVAAARPRLRPSGSPVAWSAGRAMAPLPRDAGGSDPRTDQSLHVRAQVDAAVAPLLAEIARLRAEVAQLRELPAELSRGRRSDMLTLGGLLLVAFAAAAVVMTLVLRG